MKESMKKVSSFLRKVFGYGITFCLLAGGLTFVGYLIALVLGGTAAEQICRFIYKTLFPYIIKTSTIMVLLGLVVMYMNGETALTSGKKKQSKNDK